jgi:type 1 glutamine amidotransferase
MKILHRNLCIAGLTATALLCASTRGLAEEAKKVLFFSKSSGFEHSSIKKKGDEPSVAEAVLAELGKKNNIEFTFTKDGSIFTPENIAKFDAFFFYTTGDLTEAGGDHNPPMSKEGKAAFLAAIHDGKGFVGTHSATDTFHSPGNKDHGSARYVNDGDDADPYVKMIGAEFIVHGTQQTAHLTCADHNFPGLKDFPADFAPVEEWYSLKDFAPNLHVLLVQETGTMKTSGNDRCYDRPPYPESWARMYGQGRVFYTSMGHRENIWNDNQQFREFLTGGLNWVLHRVDADVTPNIDQVTPKASTLPPAH